MIEGSDRVVSLVVEHRVHGPSPILFRQTVEPVRSDAQFGVKTASRSRRRRHPRYCQARDDAALLEGCTEPSDADLSHTVERYVSEIYGEYGFGRPAGVVSVRYASSPCLSCSTRCLCLPPVHDQRISMARELRRRLAVIEVEAANQAREAGITVRRLSEATGISERNVRQRFRRPAAEQAQS